VGKSLSYQARREVLQQVAPQYREAPSSQKKTLLDAFVATTGYHRTYARWLLNHAEEVQQTHGRSQLLKYGPDVQHALFLAWHAANRICAKRLIPFLPTLIEALERHEHLQVWRGVPQATPFHECSDGGSASRVLNVDSVSMASPPHGRERCSSNRFPSARSRSGMRPDPVFWKQNGRAHCGTDIEGG
jgi:hypothetical protein